MLKATVVFNAPHRYEIDTNEDVFWKKSTKEEKIDLLRRMFFIDVFLNTTEEDILRCIQVTFNN